MRERNAFLAGALAMCIAIAYTGYLLQSDNAADPPQCDELERYILGKLTSEEIWPGYTPVLVYACAPGTNLGRIAGSGTLFTGANGVQLLTAAHVFHENYGSVQFIVRQLRPLEGITVAYGVEAFNAPEKNIPGWTDAWSDVVLCTLGKNVQPLKGFYGSARQEVQARISFEFAGLQGRTVRSLVSGETVALLAQSQVFGHNIRYFLASYVSRGGESGTGFVSPEGDLLVLKGTAFPGGDIASQRAESRPYAVLIGGFRKRDPASSAPSLSR